VIDPVRIVQVSDCHLPADPRRRYRGINPRLNLEALLVKIEAIRPDLLLLTGDLSDDGSRASYLALRSIFGSLETPVLALPGNHDDPALLETTFPGSPVGGISVSDHGAWQIVRLDSCMPGRPEGRIGDRAITELEEHLSRHADRPQLVALHHQPIAIGTPWIDRFPLLNPQPLLQAIDRCPAVKAVVWGHIHQEFIDTRNGTVMMGGPSSAINTVPGVEKFTPDSFGPACRWLKLNGDHTLATCLVLNRGAGAGQSDSGNNSHRMM